MWQLDGDRASIDGFDFELGVTRPADGITRLPHLAGPVLGIAPTAAGAQPLQLDDAYVRGVDLIGRYQAAEGFPFQTEVYWRINHADPSVQRLDLTLIISVQTSLLDTEPEVTITSQVGAARPSIFESGPNTAWSAAGSPSRSTVAILSEAGEASWFEAIHPTDVAEARLETDAQQPGHRWQLFSEFLEKGVIRRARLTASLLLSNNAKGLAQELFGRFSEAAPPLTV